MKKLFGILGGLMVSASAANAAVKVGDAAPDFTAMSSAGTPVHLKEVIGKAPIVLYFYPKDDTPGCTKEACSLRDNFAAFRKLNATVFGITYDSVESHKKFIEKYHLPFLLIANTYKAITRASGPDSTLFPHPLPFQLH